MQKLCITEVMHREDVENATEKVFRTLHVSHYFCWSWLLRINKPLKSGKMNKIYNLGHHKHKLLATHPNRSREVNPLQPFSYAPLPLLSLAGWPSDPIPLYLQGASGYHSPHLASRAERGICGRATAPPSNPQGFLGRVREEGKTGRRPLPFLAIL